MKLFGSENNEVILRELGHRIQETRISMNVTQAEMADKSGVAIRTIARMEQGESVNVDKVLNVLRVLGILGNLNYLIPEQELVPTEMVDIGRKRKRVTGTRKKNENKTWTWGDEK